MITLFLVASVFILIGCGLSAQTLAWGSISIRKLGSSNESRCVIGNGSKIIDDLRMLLQHNSDLHIDNLSSIVTISDTEHWPESPNHGEHCSVWKLLEVF